MSLVLSRLDYSSATFAGLLANSTDRLQSMLNATARLIYSRWRYNHVTPLLRELHWLKMRQQSEYMLAVLVYRCLNGLAPSYLGNDLVYRCLNGLAPSYLGNDLVYRCLNGLAPSYLGNDLQCMADLDSRRRLNLLSTFALVVPSTCLSTVGDRAFQVAVARVWNALPAEVTSSPSHSRES